MKTTSRDIFRESVFMRDNHKCVICGKPAVDAYHIMESNPNTIEGYVVRLSQEYHYSEFRNVCGKYVRKNHV